MPLGPTSSPPQPQHIANSKQPEHLERTEAISSSQTASKVDRNSTAHCPEPESSSSPICKKVPCITLDADMITDTMAARLGMSLLGHVLFLKSQVPFPVVQLARMPGAQSNTRASRKRADLLSSFDTLASHLQTTFTALSTAIARRNSNIKTSLQVDDPAKFTTPDTKEPPRLSRVFLAIVLGPSATSAKSRVMFVVDGLEVKVWGKRDDDIDVSSRSGLPGEEGDGDENAKALEGDEGGHESDESEDESSDSEEGTECEISGDDSDSGDSGSELGSDLESGLGSSADSLIDGSPPPSRSPSPSSTATSSLSHSRPASPSSLIFPEPPTPHQPQTQLSEHHSTPDLSANLTPEPQIVIEPPAQLEQQPAPTYASEQQALRTAERLLSRTLATACAEPAEEQDGGKSMGMNMAAEMAPTQTHILLRAPRRFVHPAWTPKMNWGGTMDGVLNEFLEESGLRVGERGNRRRKGRVEGVWIRCRGSSFDADDGQGGGGKEVANDREDEGEVELVEDEEDDMIWWSWDGKIVGFSDW